MNNLSCKKITFLINSLGGGGAEGVCVNLANGLVERGWVVTLVVLHLNNAVRHHDLNTEVRLVVLDKNHARTAIFALWRFLRQNQPDKILVFNHQLAVLLVLIRAFSNLKFKIIARNISTLSQKKADETSFWHKYIVQWITKLFYRKVDQIIAQSKGMANDLIAFYGIPKNKITIIYNPISPPFEQVLVEDSIKKSYLLCVGRLESVKAFHYAINAFATLAINYPQLRLKLVGQGSLEHQLKDQAVTLGVVDRVDFEGYQTDMVPYYLGAKATLLTSLYEGFPNALVESIALGTPVVAFDCPSGPNEIVINGVNGFLVKYLCIDDLVCKLKLTLEADWCTDDIRNSAMKFKSREIIKKYKEVLE